MMNEKITGCATLILSTFINVQVESYNFRSEYRPAKSVETQKHGISDTRSSVEHKYLKGSDHQMIPIKKSRAKFDRRGMMPHERGPQRVNLSSEPARRDNRFNQNAKHPSNHTKYSDDISQSTHKNWRFEGSANDIQQKVSRDFIPRGNNLDLLTTPYKGEFYSRGGKPFAIDPGLLGRWK